MTILSDRQIKELCEEPNAYYIDKGRNVYFNTRGGVYVPKGVNDYFLQSQYGIGFKPMIAPFVAEQVRSVEGHKVLSYGVSSYGYDVRVSNKFKIFTNINSTVVDPLDFKHGNYVDFEGDVCIIPPNSFVLASTVEYFNMPIDVTGIVVGKSTYARCGVNCICTPLEAGWSGELVLEFANCTPLPVKLYANQGVAQIFFLKGEDVCETSYDKRSGKYQNQTGIQLPIG